MSAREGIQQGMEAYSSDGRLLGTVEWVDDAGIRVGGQQVLTGMIGEVSGNRVQVNYTAAQFLWQGQAPADQQEGMTEDPSGAGEMVDLLDQREDKPVKS